MPSIKELHKDLTKLLGKNSHKLDEYTQLLKGRPKVKEAWKRKRNAEQFKISSNNRGSFIIKGWDDLLIFIGKKESTVRVYFSNGEGRFSIKGYDPETGDPENFTIERVFGSDFPIASSMEIKKMVVKANTLGVIRDTDTGEIIDRKGKY